MNEEVAEANENAAQRMADYKREAGEIAARIANDQQAIMALVEQIALSWAKDGLLNREQFSTVFDYEARQHVRVRGPNKSPIQASATLASTVKDCLDDALSAAAKEAIDEVTP